MKIPGRYAFVMIGLLTTVFTAPAVALELPWEKEGGTVPSQMPGQQRPAGYGAQAPGTQTGQRYAILLGVGRFKDAKFPGLNYTRSDAEAVYEYLTNGCWSNREEKKTDRRQDPTLFSNVPGLGMSLYER